MPSHSDPDLGPITTCISNLNLYLYLNLSFNLHQHRQLTFDHLGHLNLRPFPIYAIIYNILSHSSSLRFTSLRFPQVPSSAYLTLVYPQPTHSSTTSTRSTMNRSRYNRHIRRRNRRRWRVFPSSFYAPGFSKLGLGFRFVNCGYLDGGCTGRWMRKLGAGGWRLRGSDTVTRGSQIPYWRCGRMMGMGMGMWGYSPGELSRESLVGNLCRGLIVV